MTKKIITGLLALGVIGSLATTAFAQTSTTTSTTTPSANVTQFINQLQLLRQLSQGMSGDDVRQLQQILAQDPSIYPEGLITGHFGPLTANAVKKFQKKHGLPQVGRVGPLTLQVLLQFRGDNGMFGTSTASSTIGRHDDHGDNQGEDNNQGDNGDHGDNRIFSCTGGIPPGHLIAPGWLKTHGDGAEPNHDLFDACTGRPIGTTTPPTSTSTQAVAPVISSVSATTLGSTTARVTWLTDQFSTSQIYYGTGNPVLTATTSTALNTGSFTLGHAFNLTGLTASTTYNFVVASTNMSGQTSTSSQMSFVTSGM